MRAVAYRMQELAAGGPRPELQRQLQQIARELPQNWTRHVTAPRSAKARHAIAAGVEGS
jgi:hypothetical protein